MAPVLSVDNLTVSFPGRVGPIPVVEGVSLSLEAGSSLVIAGESGSGENTWHFSPSRAAAIASIRPSWPPPRIPMVSPGFSFTWPTPSLGSP